MADHYHVIVELGLGSSLPQIVHAVNSYSVTAISKHLRLHPKPKIWQGKPWVVGITEEKMFWQKVSYVLLNPWKSGLVSHPLDDYPFSDIREWREREEDEFLLDLFEKE
jgi:hypothetical protein